MNKEEAFAQLTRLAKSQEVQIKRIEVAIANGKRRNLEKRTLGFYEGKLSELSQLWEIFGNTDIQIQELEDICGPNTKCAYITEQKYNVIAEKYHDYVADLLDGKRVNTPIPQLPAAATTTQPPLQTTQSTPLPRINLPNFNGEYERWRSFHDLFVSVVHNNEALQPVQKLHYLKGCLGGEAERLLRHIPITNNDYASAWEKLKQRYDNTRILINMQLKRLINQSPAAIECTEGLRSLQDTTEECLQQLKAMGVSTENWDVLLIHILTKGLHPTTIKSWEEELGESAELPTLQQFTNFLQTRARILESIHSTMSDRISNSQPKERFSKGASTKTYHTLKKTQDTCPACEQSHYITTCKTFIDMNPSKRMECIAKSGRCFNCYSKQHTVKQCTNAHRCRKCSRKHHTMLHVIKTTKAGPNNHSSEEMGRNSNDTYEQLPTTQAFFAKEEREATLATMKVHVTDFNNKETTLRCLIDPGSQASFITYDTFKHLGLKATPTKMSISGLNQTNTGQSKLQTKIVLRSCLDKTKSLLVECFVISKISNALPSKSFKPSSHWTHLAGLPLADPTYWQSGSIDMLIGVDIFADMMLNEIIKGPKNAPIGMRTIFGWIILGRGATQQKVESFCTLTNMEELNKNLMKFWEQEEVSNIKVQSPADEQCEQHFLKTHQRLNNGQYQVRLPFVKDKDFGLSKHMAMKRFEHLQGKLQQNPQLRKEYNQCLNEYISLDHMRVVKEDTANHIDQYFIPHHAVFKASTTTKLRVVFDASAKTTNGKSLNEQLHTGPTLQPKLFSTLLKWRKYKVAMTADIEKMYRMIKIHPDDRRFQRILWTNTNNNICSYELQTVTFGTASAPYLAIRTLLQLAQDELQNWPMAALATKTDFYVDDLLTGADTIQEAKQLQYQLINMLKAGHFNLRKWASNNKEFLSELPIEQVESREFLQFDKHETMKTLGIQWMPKLDIFTFKFKETTSNHSITKRQLLSEISSVYDPLGWISPVTITAKILMQQLWIEGYSWDLALNETIKEKWNKYKRNLKQLENLQIPRWVGFTTQSNNMQLHGFCDASMRAYAAAIYLRVKHEDGKTTVHLLTAKTRVTPVKCITLPRLELCGAVLLAKLIDLVRKGMNLNTVPIFAWTDSTITLQWIQSNPTKWTTYVANRISEIQTYVKPENWRHVPTKDNPADMASRGIDAKDLEQRYLWWNGPDWLTQPEITWPAFGHARDSSTNIEKRKRIVTMMTITNSNTIWEKYSSFNKLHRIIATIQRFIYNSKPQNERNIGPLTEKELANAANTIFKHLQKKWFSEEYNKLQSRKPLDTHSKLLSLNPFMDLQRIIRVGGRLENANISYTQQHPIILPPKDNITQLLIINIHQQTLHGGKALVLNTSRQNYWIINAQKIITKCINQCHTCIRFRKQTRSQLMGNLPACRTNINPPFFNVGIDYAGPIQLKHTTLRNTRIYKGYFCIFVCMATKAIHLELTSDLTSTAFIAALRRFISRRGICKNIYSDCGSNFKGAEPIINKELREAIKTATNIAAKYLLQQYSIQWHFNPPLAPHFGGIWESGVKAVKYHLRRIIGKCLLTYEEYNTLLCQVEACLNSRPLCPLDNTIDSLDVLTPGHFLVGRPLNALPNPNVVTKGVPSQRWKHIQYMVQQFWNKWMKEYLNTLQHRYKWK